MSVRYEVDMIRWRTPQSMQIHTVARMQKVMTGSELRLSWGWHTIFQ